MCLLDKGGSLSINERFVLSLTEATSHVLKNVQAGYVFVKVDLAVMTSQGLKIYSYNNGCEVNKYLVAPDETLHFDYSPGSDIPGSNVVYLKTASCWSRFHFLTVLNRLTLMLSAGAINWNGLRLQIIPLLMKYDQLYVIRHLLTFIGEKGRNNNKELHKTRDKTVAIVTAAQFSNFFSTDRLDTIYLYGIETTAKRL